MASVSTLGQRANTLGRRGRRACRNCAQVKERCVSLAGSNSGPCQRCHRLQKECTMAAPVHKGRPRRSQHETQSRESSSGYLPTPPSILQTPAPSENYSTPGYWEGYATLESDVPSLSPTLDALDPERKEALFREYQNNMITYFPFVVLEQSSSNAPPQSSFAYAAVLVPALHRQPALQKQVSRELLQYISTAMLMHGKKSLDLLQGLLVLVAWYPFYTQRNPQLMNLLHLAKSLLIDLGLTRCHSNPALPIRTNANVPELLHGAAINAKQDSLAARRALLGCYYASALLAVNLRRLEHPRWTSWMDECRHRLEESGEAMREDALAAHLLRLHTTAEFYLGVEGVKPSTGEDSRARVGSGVDLEARSLSLPVDQYVQRFTADMDRVAASAPLGLSDHFLVRMHKQALEISLYDAVTGVSTSDSHALAAKIDALWALLQCLKSFFDLICSMPSEEMPNLSVLVWSMVGQATDVLTKLTFLKLDGWDLSLVRQRLPIKDVVEQLSDKFQDVFLCERRRFPTLDASQFAVFVLKFRQFRKWYEERVAKEQNEGGAEAVEAMDGTDGDGENGSGFGEDLGWEWGDTMWLGEAWLDLGGDDMQMQWPNG